MVRSAAEEGVWAALEGVQDPELPVLNIVELGLVRGVAREGAHVLVEITPTFSACPALHTIRSEIVRVLEDLGLQAEVRTLLAPPWTTDAMTDSAREKLSAYGIAPPAPGALLQLAQEAPRCPRCGSFDTALTNTFGSTLCKTMHVCQACREPFEAFKTI